MSKETKQDKNQDIIDSLKTQIYLDNMFYQEWLDDKSYTEDDKIIKERITPLKEHIQTLDINEQLKENILNSDYFLNLLAHVDFVNNDNPELDLTNDELNDLATEYDKVNNFFRENEDNAFNVYDKYGIVTKNSYGTYNLDDVIMEIAKDNDIMLDNSEQEDTFKKVISNLYDDRTQLPNNDLINKASEEQNGINLKHFIFCEEYIKRGKIKPTCEYLGISRNTAYLWLKDEKVQTYLKDRQDEIKRETDDTFIQTYRESFNELNKMIKSDYMQNADKIKAIDVFLKHYENIERLKQPSTTYED
ncbi:MAG: hypothetical protein IJ094_07875 [Bacilli bacterium]|nr:hypothetical protein [Bacilli bacterium]